VQLRSWGWEDSQGHNGGITIDGKRAFDTSGKGGEPQYVASLAIFNFPACTVSNQQWLDVNHWIQYASGQSDKTIILGVTGDTYIWPPPPWPNNRAFAAAGPIIQQLGGPAFQNDPTIEYASKFQCIFQIGSPGKTYFQSAYHGGNNIIANFVFNGTSSSDVTIKRV
jgi:hypothetical protein